jgi:hypothetical protein
VNLGYDDEGTGNIEPMTEVGNPEATDDEDPPAQPIEEETKQPVTTEPQPTQNSAETKTPETEMLTDPKSDVEIKEVKKEEKPVEKTTEKKPVEKDKPVEKKIEEKKPEKPNPWRSRKLCINRRTLLLPVMVLVRENKVPLEIREMMLVRKVTKEFLAEQKVQLFTKVSRVAEEMEDWVALSFMDGSGMLFRSQQLLIMKRVGLYLKLQSMKMVSWRIIVKLAAR